jgi:hypothetical protein
MACSLGRRCPEFNRYFSFCNLESLAKKRSPALVGAGLLKEEDLLFGLDLLMREVA